MSKLVNALWGGSAGAGGGGGEGAAEAGRRRSQYSLVSSQELSPAALELWHSLPEEVKYDSTLAIFHRLAEKEQTPDKEVRPPPEPKTLHPVASAPCLDVNILTSKLDHKFAEFLGLQKKQSRTEVGEGKEERVRYLKEDKIGLGVDAKGFKKNDYASTLNSGLSSCGSNQKLSRIKKAKVITRITVLVAIWLFFTLVFMTTNLKEEIYQQTFVRPGEIKEYTIHSKDPDLRVLATLSGPFLTENMQTKNHGNIRDSFEKSLSVKIWMEKVSLLPNSKGDNGVKKRDIIREVSSAQIFVLVKENIDFAEGVPRNALLIINTDVTNVINSKHNNNDKLAVNQAKNNNDSDTVSDIDIISKNNTAHNDIVSGNDNQETTFDNNKHFNEDEDFVYVLKMSTNSNKTVPLSLMYQENPLDKTAGLVMALVLLCGLYILIIFEVINRCLAAVITSTASLAVLALTGARPSLPELISWLDAETLLLLFSMMVLVAVMAETGLFDALAVYTFEVTKGKLWPLVNSLCVVTAVMSLVLDNVTTVLLMTPVTIRLCEVMELDPVPILISMVLFCNVGGTATPVGDPPNVIMASNKDVVAAGIHFTNFTMHMSLGIILVGIQTYFQLRFLYRDTNKLRHHEPKNIVELRRQIGLWRRAMESLPALGAEAGAVRARLDRKVLKLQSQLQVQLRENTKRACPQSTFDATLRELKEKYKIRDKTLLIKASVALTFVVIMFFLHSLPGFNRVSPGWTALLGAVLLLILADKYDIEPILLRVEWSTLLFFAALFVFIEALSKLGLIEYIGGMTQSLILQVNEEARLAVAIIILIWVSGITSAFVDNVPLTTMMIRIVTNLGTNPALNLPMAPLVWALSFGVCLGGNGTLIGASANVVCAGVAEQNGYKIPFMTFTKIGFPLMLGHLIVASVYLIVCHCVFTWH